MCLRHPRICAMVVAIFATATVLTISAQGANFYTGKTIDLVIGGDGVGEEHDQAVTWQVERHLHWRSIATSEVPNSRDQASDKISQLGTMTPIRGL